VPFSHRFRRALVAVAVTAVVGLCPAAAGAAVVASPSDIPADCSVDVTARLQAAINAAPDGSTLQFPAAACFRVDGTLVVKAKTNLTIDGRGATIRQVTNGTELLGVNAIRSRSVWSFQQNTNVTLQDVIVRGANLYAGLGDLAYSPKFEGQHAFVVAGGTNTVIQGVQAYDIFADFVYAGPGVNGLLVRDSTFARNGRQGWTINGLNVTFDRNTISDVHRSTVDLEPTYTNWVTRNVTVSNNTIGRGRGYFVANQGQPYAPIDGVNIIGNRLIGKTMIIVVGGHVGDRNNYRVIGNTTDTPISANGSGMHFNNVHGLEVRDNVSRAAFRHRYYGLTMWHSRNVTISGNRWANAAGVWIDRGGNVDVKQSGNSIGTPIALTPATATTGPTPARVGGIPG
jgi:hypothetical protein